MRFRRSARRQPERIYVTTWSDSASAAPAHPSQSQLAAEAVKAAAHFGNTTVGTNASVQYVIATAHNNASGFGTQYCAWYSSTTSSYGDIAYTNLPYMTDAGASCGVNFTNGGSAGLTDGGCVLSYPWAIARAPATRVGARA